jgi:hypothetical protein
MLLPGFQKACRAFGWTQVAVLGLAWLGMASLAFGLMGCGASNASVKQSEMERAREAVALEAFFLQWRKSLHANDWPQVMGGLSSSSKRWLSDIARSARMDDLSLLRDKRFEDVVFILGLRVDRRLQPQIDDRPMALLSRLFSEGSPLRRAFLHAQLGPYHVTGNRAWSSLREAPNTPVFEFVKEPGGWALHWEATLPLIMRGAESQSRPHGKNNIEQAIWLLRTWAGKEVYAEDLRR